MRDGWQPCALRGVTWIVASGGALAIATFAHAAGSSTTACVHLCPDLGNPCVVRSAVTVVPGSTIDCGTRAVQVTGGDLTVHDGRFVLKAASVQVVGRTIRADCPQGTGRQGFTLVTTGDISLGPQANLLGSCDVGGAEIVLEAGGSVGIGGTGI